MMMGFILRAVVMSLSQFFSVCWVAALFSQT